MDTHTDGQWHRTMLVDIARRMKPSLYVELGVERGFTFQAVAPFCARAIGVDVNCPGIGGELYEMTTDAFFVSVASDLPEFELTFIDADHRSGQALWDFKNAWERTAKNGLVILHDTYPENDQEKGDGFCSDSYVVPGLIRKKYPDAEVLTFPFPPGLTIVRKP